MFPVTDSSQTIIDCLIDAARKAGVTLVTNCGVEAVERTAKGFLLKTTRGGYECERLLLAMGGCRTPAQARLALDLGHSIEPPVPSLFTFHIRQKWVHELAGLTAQNVEVAIPETNLREKGAILFTHWGLSGPAILRLSAWGARKLEALNYKFRLQINWLGGEDAVRTQLLDVARRQPAKFVVNTPIGIPARLWEALVLRSGVRPRMRWSGLSRGELHTLTQWLIKTELEVEGKSLNKEEFVTCGGIRLDQVNFSSMESRICPGLYLAGELLDIDGITGGFNFQSAWTTGWIAGNAIAQSFK
jgi:hypothetical protein